MVYFWLISMEILFLLPHPGFPVILRYAQDDEGSAQVRVELLKLTRVLSNFCVELEAARDMRV